MFYEHIQHNYKCQQVPKRSQGGNAHDFRGHVGCTDDTGTDQQCHDPKAHDDIADQSSQKLCQVVCDLKIQIDLA